MLHNENGAIKVRIQVCRIKMRANYISGLLTIIENLSVTREKLSKFRQDIIQNLI